MKCNRCQGHMLKDHFLDMEESFGGMWSQAWRCLNCGHTVDPVIAANRQRQAALHHKTEQIVHDIITETKLAA